MTRREYDIIKEETLYKYELLLNKLLNYDEKENNIIQSLDIKLKHLGNKLTYLERYRDKMYNSTPICSKTWRIIENINNSYFE
jgi:hypothetical protein